MTTVPPPDDDDHAWLEAVDDAAALAWVRERNTRARTVLDAEPGFDVLRTRVRAMLDAPDRIPLINRRGGWLFNLWQDAAQPRGLWRRTPVDAFLAGAPAWQTLLDLDALAQAEGEPWVWAGASVLGPAYRHALVQLSRGGADATVVREFDLETLAFVADGFVLPEAKTRIAWGDDADTVYVGTDVGPGSLTDSGYPRVLKRWRRGEPLARAETVFEGEPADVSVAIGVDRTPGFERTVVSRALDFYRSRQWLLRDGALLPLPKPDDAEASFWRGFVLLLLRSAWHTPEGHWPAGSLIAADAEAFVAGQARWQPVFTPTATCALAGWDATASRLVLSLVDQVAGRVECALPTPQGWQRQPVETPHPGALDLQCLHDPLLADDPHAEAWLIGYRDFLTPDRLLLGSSATAELRTLQSLPAHFDATGMRVEQRFARSRDGTAVPYFVVWPRSADDGGDRPTLLYGYGGFEVSRLPFYSGAIGAGWLECGGVFVLANIRGGGEYGPAWHQAALREHRQRSYDDFIAVAEALQADGITRPARLGIMGGSNGGLLVGAVMLQRPELFGAVVCQVPLLDMRRFHRLLAGASWMAEYGNPDDPADWAFIGRYSPYQNLRAGLPLPALLLVTSTRDDRVHPGHARKFAARAEALGYPQPASGPARPGTVYSIEFIEGGHGAAADNAQRADRVALEFAFLWRHLGPGS